MNASPLRLQPRGSRWWRRVSLLGRRRRAAAAAEVATLIVTAAMLGLSYVTLRHGAPQRPLSPGVIALLLVANLVPAMGLLVLLARRIARARANRLPLGGRGQLHVRLVALFSVLAAVPTLLVVIFASLLFQYGVQVLYSDRARTVLENADRVAQTYVNEHSKRLAADDVAMAGDLLNALATAPADDPRWDGYFASQVFYRSLDQAAMIRVGGDGGERLIWGANLDKRPLDARLPRGLLPALADGKPHVRVQRDRIEAVLRFDEATHTFLYIARNADPVVLAQAARANTALGDYREQLKRSRALQLRFNLALFVVSLLIVAVAIFFALTVADRLVRPIGALVGAARRVAAGDLAARVAGPERHDEVGTLATAFNRMTRRLQEQTAVLESRRALTEAVLSGVSAGVISVDGQGLVTIVNLSAAALLHASPEVVIGRPLDEVSPELAALLRGGEREAVVQVVAGGDTRTLAVKAERAREGHVLTFDDITQQLADQRRAAWADVARRIAHEIKNPLTPIQLAAERLQRRYGRDLDSSDGGTFEKLVSTIVRQVGDIRQMIDEFSAFARMPKPQFAEESLVDIARHALFLHEVAHPAIRFSLEAPAPAPRMVCDRRQLGQALTNLVKNAVEAIEARSDASGSVAMSIALVGATGGAPALAIEVADDGVGLPVERERLTEPYMTTRAKGTGLGLAIVDKIVEEHLGTMVFVDRPGGGAIVRLTFDPSALEPLAAPAGHDPEPAFVRS